jgi:alpha-tubulin suppressor-like RCC1 family protein
MACGLATDDNVYCWGEAGGNGSLGDGVTKKSRVPVRVALPGPVTQISAGYSGECALLADGTIWCWNESAAASKLDSEVRFAKLSSGYPQCAIAESGDAYCWGGGYGRLGIGDADTDCQYGPSCLTTKVPLPVAGNHKWIDISVGTVSACGITTDHRAYCWGEMYPAFMEGPRGLLGAGSFIGSKSPVPVVGGMQFNSVSVGTRHACGIAVDKSAYCWGQNGSGQLGVGFPGPNVASPQRVAGKLGFEALSAAEVTCGVSVGKNLYCWGIAYGGALGIGVSGPGMRSIPTRTSSPKG